MSMQTSAPEREHVNSAVAAGYEEHAPEAQQRGLRLREVGLLAAGVALGTAAAVLVTRPERIATLALGGRRTVLVSLPFSGIRYESFGRSAGRQRPALRRVRRAQRPAAGRATFGFVRMPTRRGRRAGRFERFARFGQTMCRAS